MGLGNPVSGHRLRCSSGKRPLLHPQRTGFLDFSDSLLVMCNSTSRNARAVMGFRPVP